MSFGVRPRPSQGLRACHTGANYFAAFATRRVPASSRAFCRARIRSTESLGIAAISRRV
jgi:hypothetical protein